MFCNLVLFFIVLGGNFPSYFCDSQEQYENNIIFYGFASDGSNFTTNFDDNDTLLEYCETDENYTIVVHGWTESLKAFWVLPLVENYRKYRHGCVFVMDYFHYSKLGYMPLLSHFFGIQGVLTRKLQQLDDLGFDPDNAFLFGFSYGSHLVFEASYQYGPHKIARIDACDPAAISEKASVEHAIDAAKDVQCIHTSVDIGTRLRYCPKDVNMGICGIIQPPVIRSHHFMCPVYYNNAFENDFKMVSNEAVFNRTLIKCKTEKEVDVTDLGDVFMGFNMDMTVPDGEYFALSKIEAPFNVL